MDGGHTIERCEEVTTEVLSLVYAELTAHRVGIEGTLLKPNMVVSGRSVLSRPMRHRSPRRRSGRSGG